MAEPTTPYAGLTSAEVAERVAKGQTNAVRRRASRSVADIVRANVFTWFNLILGVLWVLMVSFGSWRDALFGTVLVTNTAIGIAQEVRAKITLERLSLISAPKARVVRDGAEREVPTAEVVLDDLVALEPGEQIVVDGEVVLSDGLEVDESALTGESAAVVKRAGDAVMSGSFVVAGRGLCKAVAVGPDAYAARIEATGRRFVRARSEVREGLNRILRVIGVMLVPVGLLTVATGGRSAPDVASRVTNAVAALVSMVPEGLVLLSSIAFALSAIALANHRVLVNELYAVEGLARTDVLLTDKTGTLTEHEPVLGRFEPLASTEVGQSEARAALGALAGADPTPNSTIRAIASAVAAPDGWVARTRVPFSPARKWSAVDFGEHGAWILGAPDVVLARAEGAEHALARLGELAHEGSRVLVLARAAEPLPAGPPPPAPPASRPVGFVLLVEQLRTDAADTVRYLGEQGVTIKIVSGDAPGTASAIAQAAGLPGAEQAVDARTLTGTEPLESVMERAAVFGRVMPEQKAAMVEALQRSGHTVSMTGDGVNDVLALKQADLGIAMGAGVPAARAVAEVVLLDNRFATLPLVMAEGRRVLANAERVSNLFLTKSVWAMLLAVAVAVLGVPFPFLPRQVTLAGSVAIGIPAFFFALARNTRPYRSGFVKRVLRFAVPTGIVVGLSSLASFLMARGAGVSLEHARTLATLVLTLTSLGVIAILEWPLTGARLAVVAGMAALLALAFAVPFARDFFALAVPTRVEFAEAVLTSAIAIAATAALTRGVRSSVRGL